MKWNDEEVHRLCQSAYQQGIRHEKACAIEAYRLHCCHLIGNRCMNPLSMSNRKRVCDGECLYIHRYERELYLLET